MPESLAVQAGVLIGSMIATAGGMWAGMRQRGGTPEPAPAPTPQPDQQTAEHVSPTWMAEQIRDLVKSFKGWPRHDERLIEMERHQGVILESVQALALDLAGLRRHLDEEQVKREKEITAALLEIAAAQREKHK